MRNRPLMATFLALALCACAPEEPRRLVLATTTSVQDSGLLDVLIPPFAKAQRIRVQAVAVGTGAALRMGAEGNADALLTHAKAGEEELVASAAVVARVPIMENYFVIAGPADDPADAQGAPSAVDALRRIAATGSPWVSRGDDSGTHRTERALFRAAGLDPEQAWDAFHSTGSGMGLTLQVAGERQAYVLSDRGTFLAFRERTGLQPYTGAEPDLRNEYAYLRVNSARFPGRIHEREARAFEEYLLGAEAQAVIREFGRERFGEPLFRPLGATAGD